MIRSPTNFDDTMTTLHEDVDRLRRIIHKALPIVTGELERITEHPCDREQIHRANDLMRRACGLREPHRAT